GGIALGCVLQAQSPFFRKDVQVVNHPGSFAGLGVTIGDFNGDGRPDMAVTSVFGISVLLNQGGGNFGRPIHTEFSHPLPLVAADFDGDGKLDLVGAGCCTPTGHILLGRGDGTFSPPREIGARWGFPAVGDFNADGKPDLALTDPGSCGRVSPDLPCSSSVTVLLGNGDGTFQPGSTMEIRDAFYPVVADFNRDGKADLAVGFRNTISILLGQGDGTFQAPIVTTVT